MRVTAIYIMFSCILAILNGIRPAYTFYLGHISAPTISLRTFTLAHVAMVKVVKLSTAAVVHAMLLRTIIIRHVKHTLAIFRANHIKTILTSHVLYHHITKYSLLFRRFVHHLNTMCRFTTITTRQEYLVLTAHVLSLRSKARTALLRAHAHTSLHIAALHLTTKTGVFHIRTKVCTSRFIQSKILNISVQAPVSIPPCKVVKALHANFLVRYPFIIIHAHLLVLINQGFFHCSLIVMLAHFICLVTQSISPSARTPFLFSSLKSFLHRFWTTTPGKTLNLLDSMLHFMQYRRLHLPGTRVFRHLTRVHNNLADIILVNIKHTGDVTITRNLITTSILKPQANILQLRISLEQLWCVHISFQRMIIIQLLTAKLFTLIFLRQRLKLSTFLNCQSLTTLKQISILLVKQLNITRIVRMILTIQQIAVTIKLLHVCNLITPFPVCATFPASSHLYSLGVLLLSLHLASHTQVVKSRVHLIGMVGSCCTLLTNKLLTNFVVIFKKLTAIVGFFNTIQ